MNQYKSVVIQKPKREMEQNKLKLGSSEDKEILTKKPFEKKSNGKIENKIK